MLDCNFLRKDLEKYQSIINPEDIHEVEGLEKDFHITVLYGIHDNKPYDVYNKLSLCPIRFKISGISLFENDEYDVLKLDIRSKDIISLNLHCCENLTYTNSYTKYVPHLTIGYLKKGTGKKYLGYKLDIKTDEQISDKFVFSDKNSQKVEWIIRPTTE